MKIYKQSIILASATRTIMLPMIIISIIICIIFINTIYIRGLVILFISIILFFGLLALSQFFYIVTTDEKLLIKNPVLRFWGAAYRYSEIKKIEIGNTGGVTRNFIRVITDKKKSRRYVIDLVSEKDYPELIWVLREKGIPVEIIKIRIEE